MKTEEVILIMGRFSESFLGIILKSWGEMLTNGILITDPDTLEIVTNYDKSSASPKISLSKTKTQTSKKGNNSKD